MTVYAPSRIYVIGVYLKRIVRWRRISWPYLSVDAFAKLADVEMYRSKYKGRAPSFKEIVAAKVVFCPSDRLEEFLSTYKGLIHPKVIISGNTDFEFHKIPENVPRSVKLMLLQNSFISDDKWIHTMPIGVENFRYGVNGHPRLFRYTHIPKNARGKILFGPFGATHSIREQVKLEFRNIPDKWIFLNSRIKPIKYRKLIEENFEFIVSVRGNGVDTHRLWETLYRGRKPIVQKDSWLSSLKFLDSYVYPINDWTVSEVSKVQEVEIIDFDPSDIPQLWMPYWRRLVEEFKS
jgi:hypothetical protein